MRRFVYILCIVVFARSLFIVINPFQEKCFNTVVFNNEHLLLDINTEELPVATELVLKVTVHGTVVLETTVSGVTKITVDNKLTSNSSALSNDYQTCLFQKQLSSSVANPISIMVSLQMLNNFMHRLTRPQNVVDYRKLKQISDKIHSLSQQQITLHQENEQEEQKTHNMLESLLLMTVLATCLQCLLFLLTSIAHALWISRIIDNK